MRSSLLLLLLAATASAGFLPLVHDRPKRDNPFDPKVKVLELPVASFPTFTITPTIGTPSATPTAVPSCGGPDTANFATFEGGTEAWASETYTGYTVMSVSAGAPSCYGVQALGGSATLAHLGSTAHLAFKKNLAPAQNWVGRSLAARVYFPAGYAASSANLYVKVGAGYSARIGPLVSAPSGGGWASLILDVSALPSLEAGDIKEVGVDIYSAAADPDGAVSYRIDSIHLLGGPTPTITPTFSTTPTLAIGTHTASPTASPTPSPTATPLPACGAPSDSSSIATFEGGIEAWASESYAGPPPYTVMALVAGTPACLGAQALCGTATWTHAGSEVKVGFKKNYAGLNWTGADLSARLYFPAGVGTGTSAKLFVKTGAGYAYYAGAVVAAPAGGGWVLLTQSLAAVPNASDVREVGVDVYSANGQPDGVFTLCVDGVNR